VAREATSRGTRGRRPRSSRRASPIRIKKCETSFG
jgi:hypothetical protein